MSGFLRGHPPQSAPLTPPPWTFGWLGFAILLCFWAALLMFGITGVRNYTVFLPLGLILGFFLLKRVLVGRLDRDLTVAVLVALAWTIPCGISVVNAVDVELHLKAFLEHALFVIFSMVIINFVMARGLQQLFVRWTARIIGVVTAMTLLISFMRTDGGLFSSRFAATYPNPNLYAGVVVFLLCPILLTRNHGVGLLTKCALFVGLILSGSSAGFLTLFLVLILVLVSSAQRWRKWSVLMIALCLPFVVSGSTVADRLEQKVIVTKQSLLTGEYEKSSGSIRLFLAVQAFDRVADSPLVGVGLNNAKFAMVVPEGIHPGPDKSKRIDTQSNYLEVAVSGGLVALLLYYLPLMAAAVLPLSRSARLRLVALGFPPVLLLGLILTALVLDIGAKSYNVFPYAFIRALCILAFIKCTLTASRQYLLRGFAVK